MIYEKISGFSDEIAPEITKQFDAIQSLRTILHICTSRMQNSPTEQ